LCAEEVRKAKHAKSVTFLTGLSMHWGSTRRWTLSWWHFWLRLMTTGLVWVSCTKHRSPASSLTLSVDEVLVRIQIIIRRTSYVSGCFIVAANGALLWSNFPPFEIEIPCRWHFIWCRILNINVALFAELLLTLLLKPLSLSFMRVTLFILWLTINSFFYICEILERCDLV
jgi:hypothetical protein